MGVTFSKDAAKRIANAVKIVEGQRPSRGGKGYIPEPAENDFLAYITGSGFSPTGQVLYSFVRVRPVMDDPDIKINDKAAYSLIDPVFGFIHCAFEANDQPTPSNVVVRVHFAGMRMFGEEERGMYIFSYTPTVIETFLPNHDHRDNFNGGFAFSVWHPGTALPQRPWAL